jgi:dihydropyrimidinase
MIGRRRALKAIAGIPLLSSSSAQESASLLVRGGRVVTAEGQTEADLRVRDGRIVEIGSNLASSGETPVEAKGLLVLPGGVDPHAHLSPPFADDFDSGSKAALAGGITSIGCMVSARENETLEAALVREEERARKELIADVFFHPVAGDPGPETLGALPRLAESGRTSLKIFMLSERFDRNEESYAALIRRAGELGMRTLLHCEDAGILAETRRRMEGEGRVSLTHFAESRPIEAEVRALERAISIGERTGSPLYVVHLSSGAALAACTRARGRGLSISVETRPLYLHFTDERYAGSDGPLFVGQPPLRKPEDVEALWRGIAEGAVDTLGSDHAPWTREQKLDPELNIAKLRPGVANLQTMLPIFFSEGVLSRKLPLERFVALTSTHAARLFGLYPRKGAIAVGSDADLVLWDREQSRVVRGADEYSRAGFSLFEGLRSTGWPVLTIRRGEIVARDGQVLGEPASGRVLRQTRTTA